MLPISANLPMSAAVPVCPPPAAPQEFVTVQRIVRPAPPRQQPREAPKPKPAPPPQPRAAPAPAPRPAPAPLLPAYIDPRPNVPHERSEKAHDFEVRTQRRLVHHASY